MTDKKISIITVNYHSLELIEKSVRSIKKFSDNSILEILVVSNSEESEDEISELKSIYSKIKYINTGSNLGFAKANNIGAEHAKGDLLFFLNPDTLFLNDAAGILAEDYLSQNKCGISGPAIFDESNEVFPSVTGNINYLALLSLAIPFWNKLMSAKNSSEFYIPQKKSDVDVLHGSAMFISKALFETVFGMNEKFFLYSEERDLCLKVKSAGYSNKYVPEAKIQHVGGATSKPENFIPLEIIKHRSRKILIQEHHPHLIFFNRLCGVIGYSWRTVISIILMRPKKVKQFYSLFCWYTFEYK